MKKWRVLFGISIIIYAVDLLGIPFRDSIGPGDFVALIFGGLTLIPIYGFSYQVAIGNKNIAITIFLLNLLGLSIVVYFGAMYTLDNLSLAQLLFSALTLTVATIFIYPQYAYAFKSNDLWVQNA